MTDKVIPEKCIGFKTGLQDAPLSWKDACAYALGIGYSTDPTDDRDLQYTYELHDEFQVNPVITTIWSTFNPFEILVNAPGFPSFNPMMLLHGEQKTEVFKRLDVTTPYLSQAEIEDVADKGKGALVTFLIKTYEKKEDGTAGDLVLVNSLSLFVRGQGGFGYKGKQLDIIPSIPSSSPTKVLTQQTSNNQALIYRLSGDINPLHVDTNMAQAGGFDKPILHGLCTYGICAKLIIQHYCDNKSDRFKSIKTRFTSHVFPGECIVLKTWYNGTGQVLFEGSTKERGSVVIIGYANIIPEQKL